MDLRQDKQDWGIFNMFSITRASTSALLHGVILLQMYEVSSIWSAKCPSANCTGEHYLNTKNKYIFGCRRATYSSSLNAYFCYLWTFLFFCFLKCIQIYYNYVCCMNMWFVLIKNFLLWSSKCLMIKFTPRWQVAHTVTKNIEQG